MSPLMPRIERWWHHCCCTHQVGVELQQYQRDHNNPPLPDPRRLRCATSRLPNVTDYFDAATPIFLAALARRRSKKALTCRATRFRRRSINIRHHHHATTITRSWIADRPLPHPDSLSCSHMCVCMGFKSLSAWGCCCWRRRYLLMSGGSLLLGKRLFCAQTAPMRPSIARFNR